MPTQVEPKYITPAIAGLDAANDGRPVSASTNVKFNCGAKENHGNVEIYGNTNGPVGKYDFVAIYSGPPPSNPNSGYVDYFYVANKTSLTTSENWGTGWYVAYASLDVRTGAYVYVVKAGPT